MECFRTIVRVPDCPCRIELGQGIVSLGSCFSEHVGNRLGENGFGTCVSPTGILYNPFSIAAAVRRLLSGRAYDADELFLHDGQWRSLDHHSRFARPDQAEALDAINRELATGHDAILQAEWLLVTFGTAVAWFWGEDPERAVANCHRLPADAFDRRLLAVDDIVGCWETVATRLREANPRLNLLFTLSPVRYLRNDAHENLASKSRLALAIDELVTRLPAAFYFPAYEIMMDDLRDYRFCGPDMTHPNEPAIDYIWSRFREAHLAESANAFVDAYAPVRRALGHRVQQRDSRSAAEFAEKQLAAVCELHRRFPDADLRKPRRVFEELAGEKAER